jgi:hypothetical protein
MDLVDIKKLENICDIFYSNSKVTPKQDRDQAGQVLSKFLENPENFRLVFSILSACQHPQLLFLSINSFCNLLGAIWKTLSFDEKDILFNCIYNMLIKFPNEPGYVVGALAKTLAKICRLGWIESQSIPETISQIELIIEQQPSKLYSGLNFFSELITEIKEPVKYRSHSINKSAILGFQESILSRIFSYAIKTLNQIQSLSEINIKLLLDVLDLSINFEFIKLDDDLNHDSSGVKVPMSWKPYFLNPIYLEILSYIIINSSDQILALALRTLSSFGCIRKKIFAKPLDSKKNYITKYLKAYEVILTSKNLAGDNLFILMQGLKNFFISFGLMDVTEVPEFSSWIEIFKNYSINLFSFKNSIISGYESSMFVWSYLSYESHILRLPMISGYIEILFQSFLSGTLINVDSDFLIENIEMVIEHIEMISNFTLYFYSDLSKLLQKTYVELSAFTVNPDYQDKLAWVIIIASGFMPLTGLNSCSWNGSFDLSMTQIIFQLAETVEIKTVCLELAFVLFFTSFAKGFINSSDENSWNSETGATEGSDQVITQAISIIIKLIFKNLTYSGHKTIIKYTIELFEYLSKNFYFAKVLIKENFIHHFMTHYPNFLLDIHNSKLKSKLFMSIGHLWINENVNCSLELVLNPLTYKISASLRNSLSIESLFRELQGICSAITSQKHYTEFFEWVLPRLESFLAPCNDFLQDQGVTNSLLKFLTEITHSKDSRIKFNSNSANGIIFFQRISWFIINYGKILIKEKTSNLHRIRKVLEVMTNFISADYVCFGVFEVYNDTCFSCSLKTIFNLLGKISLIEITVRYTQNYNKLLDLIYKFIEISCSNHLRILFKVLENSELQNMLAYLKEGVKSPCI